MGGIFLLLDLPFGKYSLGEKVIVDSMAVELDGQRGR